MIVYFYQNKSKTNAVSKTISQTIAYDCQLKETASVSDPVIILALNDAQSKLLLTSNYAYINDFHRYYFIRDIKSMRNGLWSVQLKVDVLMSFFDTYVTGLMQVARCENVYDPDLIDDEMPIKKNPLVTIDQQPNALCDEIGDGTSTEKSLSKTIVVSVIVGV